MHLGQIQRHHNQSTAINLNNPESQSMHLETRLVQLDSAISMELWQVRPPETLNLSAQQSRNEFVTDVFIVSGVSRKRSRLLRTSMACLLFPRSPPSHS